MSYNLLKGKRGIIFGALNDQSIAWKVAERAVEEGATITLSNTPMAIRMGEVDALAQKLNCQVIPADATRSSRLAKIEGESKSGKQSHSIFPFCEMRAAVRQLPITP